MDIRESEFTLSSERLFFARTETRERLQIGQGEGPGRAEPRGLALGFDRVELSAAARLLADAPGASEASGAGTAAEAIRQASEEVASDPELGLLLAVVESLIGRPIRIFDLAALGGADEAAVGGTEAPNTVVQSGANAVSTPVVNYEFSQVREESEQSTVAATGLIRTADGVEISFSIELRLSRYYREQINLRLQNRTAEPRDPLVVNFNGRAAQLSDARFRFDLDGDGVGELIPQLLPGSGYLVLDRNGNGRVDSGSELFGATSGNGFAELALADADRDGWIDALDPGFRWLRIWSPSASGGGELRALPDVGVGAVATASVASPFALRSSTNADLGAVRSTGVYVSTSNTVGTVQQIDLSV